MRFIRNAASIISIEPGETAQLVVACARTHFLVGCEYARLIEVLARCSLSHQHGCHVSKI